MRVSFQVLFFACLALAVVSCAPAQVTPEAPVPATVAAAQPATPVPTAPTATAAPAATATSAATAILAPTATPAPTQTAQPTTMPTSVASAATSAPIAAPVATAAPVACKAPLALTPAQTEGPMYLANPPQRSNFRSDAANASGEPVILAGRVLTPDCQPIANVRVDVWHTDANGNYDMTKTYTSRGYVLTDGEGRFQFETILPAIYTGRTAHIHIMITSSGGQTLTTQLYFPNAATNSGDAIFDPRLLVRLDETPQGKRATFNFVVGS